jgi:asparagine synthetase B (glutamine-hydrolysing)
LSFEEESKTRLVAFRFFDLESKRFAVERPGYCRIAMARLMQEPVNTAAVGFREDDFNELPHARRVSERFRTRHREYLVEPNLKETLKKLSWHFDEPFADASAVPTFHVSRMARETVTVALSGDGGDENFAGYRRYYFDHNATTPLLPQARQAWLEATEKYVGNPSSPHRLGQRADAARERARRARAHSLRQRPANPGARSRASAPP